MVTNRDKRLKEMLLGLAMLLSPSMKIALYFYSPLRKTHLGQEWVLRGGRVHPNPMSPVAMGCPCCQTWPLPAPGQDGHSIVQPGLETLGRNGDSLWLCSPSQGCNSSREGAFWWVPPKPHEQQLLHHRQGFFPIIRRLDED